MENPESGGSSSPQVPQASWSHPAHKVHRFIALLLMCFLCFGSYFCYDTPGALADNFKVDSHLNTSQFALLYSIYSWPNVILCFIGGYLIDRYFGVRLGTIIYMTIVLIGAIIFAFGVYINAFWVMILGRFVFGSESEGEYFASHTRKCDKVTKSRIAKRKSASDLFTKSDSEVEDSASVQKSGKVKKSSAKRKSRDDSILNIGGESLQVAVNNYVVLWFKGKELNMVFGLQLSFSRFGSTVNFWVMEPIYRWVANYYVGYERLGVALFIAAFTCLVSLICGLILGWMDQRAEKILGRQEESANEEPFHLKDILHFKSVFWLVSVICVVYYLAIFPFIALGKLFFERKFDFVPQDANTVNSMVYLLSAALSPFFGILIDKTGRNVMWVVISIFATIGAHFLLAFTFYNPFIGVIALGISYSLLASGLWPLVALIVPENQLGTAYGICQAVQNLGLATVLLLAGIIVDKYGYLMLEMFFLGCLFISLIAAVLIYIMDSASNGVLNMSPSMRDSIKLPNITDESANLLDNDENEEREETDDAGGLPSETDDSALRDAALTQSNRIRSRYLAQILPNTNIPERQ